MLLPPLARPWHRSRERRLIRRRRIAHRPEPFGLPIYFNGSVNEGAKEAAMGILWTILIGFIAGVIAKFIMPGRNEPSGFILTTILGIVGAFVASFLGQALGWYQPGEGAGLIGAVIGAIIVLAVWGMIARRRA
jgi:uncharacterized membrane protein YeaQ/YmgE (transglycosylase-associated protein family)